jgi:hypothetical protein
MLWRWLWRSCRVSILLEVVVVVIIDGSFERVAELTHKAHVLALDGQVRGMHLDQLAQEDLRSRVRLSMEAINIGNRSPNEVVHELELPADRRA